MEPASLTELKKELKNVDPKTVVELCLRIAKYKKENKELLTYLLFEADNEHGYIESIKRFITKNFAEAETGNLHRATKAVRKILRLTNKYIKYSGIKSTEAELLICFCDELLASGIKIRRSNALSNLYERQVTKIEAAVKKLHEDQQSDYEADLERLKERL